MDARALVFRLALHGVVSEGFGCIRQKPTARDREAGLLLAQVGHRLVARAKVVPDLQTDALWAILLKDLAVLHEQSGGVASDWVNATADTRANAVLDAAEKQVAAGRGRGLPARSTRPARLRAKWSGRGRPVTF